MKALYARTPTHEERRALQAGLHAKEALTVRRCQMILLSADEVLKVDVIDRKVGRSGQSVRQTIRAFNQQGIACIYPRPLGRPDDQRAFDDVGREQLREMIHRSPRDFGHDTSLWTLKLIAQVSYEQGLTVTYVHLDTISATLAELGITWKRARKHIQSPDEDYAAKKKTGLVKTAGSLSS
jgi:transposase